MALQIRRITSHDSFLLTFMPLQGSIRDAFYVLLDPVLEEEPASNYVLPHPLLPSADVFLSKHWPEPDVIIFSHNRNNHLEATLQQILTPSTTKTVILAEPSAAKTIRRCQHLSNAVVVETLSPWHQDGGGITRLPVPPRYIGGEPGEVTVSSIPPKRESKCSHAAIGITYRPPPSKISSYPLRRAVELPPPTPPRTPPSRFSTTSLHLLPSLGALTARLVPPTPPDTPAVAQFAQMDKKKNAAFPSSPTHSTQTLSVIYSPSGTPYSGGIKPYAASHLVSEAALPLTALIHNFDAKPMPWWNLGRPSTQLPMGQETALALGARAWVGTQGCDNHAVVKSKRSQRRKFLWHEVQEMLDRAEAKDGRVLSCCCKGPGTTQILQLKQGEEVALSSEGVCELRLAEEHQSIEPDALGVYNNYPPLERVPPPYYSSW